MVLKSRSGNWSYSRRSKPYWGFETGVDGKQQTRCVEIQELHNYRRITHNGFNFYVTIIDTKHPKFMRTAHDGTERWRMRFNVFGTGVFAEWLPNLVVHYGEIHVYYDLIADRQKPWCQEFTFYFDDRPVDREIIPYRYELMELAFRDSLMGLSRRMKFMLYLPIYRQSFVNPNRDLDEFLERQDILINQLQELQMLRYTPTLLTPLISPESSDNQFNREKLSEIDGKVGVEVVVEEAEEDQLSVLDTNIAGDVNQPLSTTSASNF